MKPRWMSEAHWAIIMGRLIFCHDRSRYCKAGGFIAWGNIGHYQPLQDNYGSPCVGGTFTYEDGVEVFDPRCIFCGSTG